MSTIAMIIAPVDYRDEEYEIPKTVFEKSEVVVKTFSKGGHEAHGMRGGIAQVDGAVGAFSSDEFDAVVFVGGGGAKIYFEDEQTLSIAREMVQKNKIVAAICIAPSILANAGILQGKKVTSFASEHDNLRSHGAEVVQDDVVVDGRMITANGPSAAAIFAEEILKALGQPIVAV